MRPVRGVVAARPQVHFEHVGHDAVRAQGDERSRICFGLDVDVEPVGKIAADPFPGATVVAHPQAREGARRDRAVGADHHRRIFAVGVESDGFLTDPAPVVAVIVGHEQAVGRADPNAVWVAGIDGDQPGSGKASMAPRRAAHQRKADAKTKRESLHR